MLKLAHPDQRQRPFYTLNDLCGRQPQVFQAKGNLSLDRHIAGWDVVMLTESISISLMAIFIAAWLWLLRGWSWGKVFSLSLIAFLWAFTRDTNGWILLMLSGMIQKVADRD